MDPKLVEMQGNSDDQITHLSLDIGGSLIKLAYFTRKSDIVVDEAEIVAGEINAFPNVDVKYHLVHGKLNFAKFETSKIADCLRFISSQKLHLGGCQHHKAPTSDKIIVKATGGGAHKFADLFKEKLGICFDKEDEMDSLVCGANILLKAVHQEAFTYMNGQKEYMQINNDLYPYLLVNIGSGVSMIKVDGDSKFERVSGTSIGGGTFWGLGRLLTKCKSFDELLELSQQGDNRVIDVLVGDIFGRMGYPKIGLTSSTIASSFGKAISSNKELEDYKPEDISRSLLRMISNNIGQIAYMNALQFGLKRIFFGGFFIHGHAYTMDTISVAVDYWSKGDAKAMFLRHEGFLGAMGAFMSFRKHGSDDFVQQIRSSTSCDADTKQCQKSGDLYHNQSIELECSVCACS